MEKYICNEIRQQVWESKIPVLISLALDEINGVETPPNLIVSILKA